MFWVVRGLDDPKKESDYEEDCSMVAWECNCQWNGLFLLMGKAGQLRRLSQVKLSTPFHVYVGGMVLLALLGAYWPAFNCMNCTVNSVFGVILHFWKYFV